MDELPGMPAPVAPRKGSVAWTRAELSRYQELSRKHHGLTSLFMARVALGVSRQRIHQLIEDEKLGSYEVLGKKFVPCDELQVFIALERDRGFRYSTAEI